MSTIITFRFKSIGIIKEILACESIITICWDKIITSSGTIWANDAGILKLSWTAMLLVHFIQSAPVGPSVILFDSLNKIPTCPCIPKAK
jgi:hypothetical protein